MLGRKEVQRRVGSGACTTGNGWVDVAGTGFTQPAFGEDLGCKNLRVMCSDGPILHVRKLKLRLGAGPESPNS